MREHHTKLGVTPSRLFVCSWQTTRERVYSACMDIDFSYAGFDNGLPSPMAANIPQMMRTRRETPVQLGHPLRDPVPERWVLSLSSPPSALLHQFDDIPDRAMDWPPLPAALRLELSGTPTVFLPSRNKCFEWLGDLLVAVAIVHSAHRHVPDSYNRFTDSQY